jgi:hypothetical protein
MMMQYFKAHIAGSMSTLDGAEKLQESIGKKG